MINEIYLNSHRRFGVEIELNSFDKRNFKSYPLRIGELPEGIQFIGNMVLEEIPNSKIYIKTWHPVHHNDYWVIKPDSSCGMELCTPLLKGNLGYNTVYKIVSKIKEKYANYVDNRCSYHVHIDVSDLYPAQMTALLAYWIKCEPVFMDMMPLHRKKNRYCMCIGSLDVLQHDSIMDFDFLLKKLGVQKYFSLNTFHYNRGDRKSIEFRIADERYCSDPELAVNWIKLIMHFVECASKMQIPPSYQENNEWSSYLWLDTNQVFQVLNFDKPLSNELLKIKQWMIKQIKENSLNEELGMWGKVARKNSQV